MKIISISTAICILLATTRGSQGLASTSSKHSLRANERHRIEAESAPQDLANNENPTTVHVEKHAGGRRLLNWKCVGTSLEPTQELHYIEDYYEQYICSAEDPEPTHWNMNVYRFGIYEGRVALLSPDDEEIWGSDNQEKGTHIRMQRGGKLVLSDDDNKVVWGKHGCLAENSRIEMRKNGVFMVDSNGNVKWYIDFDGNESGCNPDPSTFPPDPCKEVLYDEDSDDPSCRMLAVNTDSHNYEQVVMEVKKLDTGEFQVTDVDKFCWFCDDSWNLNWRNWKTLKPTKFTVSFTRSGALVINGKLARDSCRAIADGDEIRGYYWEFYELPSGYECSRFGVNLLRTMIDRYENDDVWGCVSDC